MNTYNTEQWMRAHGRITRRETPELCKLGPFQASRPPRFLASEEKLQQRGTGKSTYYVMSAAPKYERARIIFQRARKSWLDLVLMITPAGEVSHAEAPATS